MLSLFFSKLNLKSFFAFCSLQRLHQVINNSTVDRNNGHLSSVPQLNQPKVKDFLYDARVKPRVSHAQTSAFNRWTCYNTKSDQHDNKNKLKRFLNWDKHAGTGLLWTLRFSFGCVPIWGCVAFWLTAKYHFITSGTTICIQTCSGYWGSMYVCIDTCMLYERIYKKLSTNWKY